VTRFYLVRHGETIWNNQIRLQGHRDIPLSDAGRQQARCIAGRLAAVALHAAYTSDLQRAAETAAIVLAGRGLDAQLLPDLREASFGVWEGLTYEEVSRLYPAEQAARRANPADVAPPGGEPLSTMLLRMQRVIARITADHPDRSVLVVTHGGPLRIFIGALLGLGLESYWKLRVDNCSLSIVDTYPEGAILSLLNDTCHLPDLPRDGGVP
jgi:alpha-ribazole phosphatase/probable phosphoglycerate mutase